MARSLFKGGKLPNGEKETSQGDGERALPLKNEGSESLEANFTKDSKKIWGRKTPKNKTGGASKAPEVRIAKKVYYRRMAKQFVTLFSGFFILATIIYLCFAITIIRVIPTNNAGFIPVRNLTAEGGVSKAGDQIVINVIDPQGDGFVERAKQSLLMTSNAAIVQVQAGPFGKITEAKNGTIAINDKIVSRNLVRAPEGEFLDNQYVVKCLSGNCAKGMSFIVSANNVYGEPLNSHVDGDDTVSRKGQ